MHGLSNGVDDMEYEDLQYMALTDLANQVRARCKQAYLKAQCEDFAVQIGNQTFKTDASVKNQNRLTMAAKALDAAIEVNSVNKATYKRNWTMADGGRPELTYKDFQELGAQVGAREESLFQRKAVFEQEISDALEAEDKQSLLRLHFDVTVGW